MTNPSFSSNPVDSSMQVVSLLPYAFGSYHETFCRVCRWFHERFKFECASASVDPHGQSLCQHGVIWDSTSEAGGAYCCCGTASPQTCACVHRLLWVSSRHPIGRSSD